MRFTLEGTIMHARDLLRTGRISRRRLTGLAAGAVAIGAGRMLPAGVRAQTIEPSSKPGESVGGERVQYLAETGHNLQEPFLSHWTNGGGVDAFGVPLSEQRYVEGSGSVQQTFRTATMMYDPSRDQSAGGAITVKSLAAKPAADDPAFAPAPPTGGQTSLVSASDGLRLRNQSNGKGDVIAVLPDNAEFIAAPGDHGDWVPGYVDGYAGWVAAGYLTRPNALPEIASKDWNQAIWQGAALGETNVRQQASTTARITRALVYGDSIKVMAWIKGEEVFAGADEWAKLEDGTFVYSRNVGRAAPVAPAPIPDNAPTEGRWFDVNLTQQLMVAYEGRTPVRTFLTTSGMAGWETPVGLWYINNRVANETMASGSIGAEHYFKLEDVLFTQYFTDVGHAIHFAWWRTPETIGRPGSHGCLNLLLDDARFCWEWAGMGTPVLTHYA